MTWHTSTLMADCRGQLSVSGRRPWPRPCQAASNESGLLCANPRVSVLLNRAVCRVALASWVLRLPEFCSKFWTCFQSEAGFRAAFGTWRPTYLSVKHLRCCHHAWELFWAAESEMELSSKLEAYLSSAVLSFILVKCNLSSPLNLSKPFG